MAAKTAKDWSLPKFWVSIRSYKKQPVKEIWGRILDLAWLKFAVAALFVKLLFCQTVARLYGSATETKQISSANIT